MKQGDSSKILTAFCHETGLIKGLAKGARSAKNKSSMASELLSINSLTYYQKRAGDLHIISKSERIADTSKIISSYIHTNIALMIAESILQSLHPEVPHPQLFERTVNILKKLNDLPSNPFILFLLHQLILASEMGIDIDLDNAPDCDCVYDIESGNWHENYNEIRLSSTRFKRIDMELLSNINRSMQILQCDDLLEQEIPSSQKLRFIDFWTRFFSFHLEKKFKYTVF